MNVLFWSCSTKWSPAITEPLHSENAPFGAGSGSSRATARRISLQQHFPQLHDEDKKQAKKQVCQLSDSMDQHTRIPEK